MGTIKDVAIYLRKSRKEEGLTDAEALSNHREILTGLADRNNWKYTIYTEVASSMDAENRPELQNLLKNLYTFDALLVMDIDRLSRNRYDSAKIMQSLKLNDIKIVTSDGKIINLNDEQEEVMTGMQEVFANYEYNQIKKRLHRGKVSSAKQGNWVSGRVPLGYYYDRTSKKLVRQEEEARTVELIFSYYTQEMLSLREIAIKLNQSGLRGKRGQPFNAKSVQRILVNNVYQGITSQHGFTTENTHEPLISKKMFSEAQKLNSQRSIKGSRAKEQKHSLSGLVKCGFCGYSLAIQVRQTVKGEARRVKGCGRRDLVSGETCHNKTTSYDLVLNAIIDSLSPHRQEILKKMEELIQFNDKFALDKNNEKEHLEDALNKADKKLMKIARMVLEDEGNEQIFNQMKKEILSEKEHILKRLDELSHLTVTDQLEDYERIVDIIDKLLHQEKKLTEKDLNSLLLRIIMKVDLFNKEGQEKNIEIIFKD
ncbi:recombinase family protein [Bacillus cereus]|nr:recombinase family protein [Bacillus cereus]